MPYLHQEKQDKGRETLKQCGGHFVPAPKSAGRYMTPGSNCHDRWRTDTDASSSDRVVGVCMSHSKRTKVKGRMIGGAVGTFFTHQTAVHSSFVQKN